MKCKSTFRAFGTNTSLRNRQLSRLTQSFETFAEACVRTKSDQVKVEQGLKYKHDHVGNLDAYTFDKEGCLKEVNSYKSGDKINFKGLARKYNLTNANKEFPENGGQVVKKYLEDSSCDLTLFKTIHGTPVAHNNTTVRRAKKRYLGRMFLQIL